MTSNHDHYIGHRRRVKTRFLQSPHTIEDYELLELLLFYIIDRKDVKPLAKNLLNNIGDIHRLIHCESQQLLSIPEANEKLYLLLVIIKELCSRSLKSKIIKQNVITSWDSLIEYLKFTMGEISIEQFKIIYLNKKNIIIADDIFSIGTIDQAPVYIRELIKLILLHGASSIVLVHNHPSSIAKPSKSDIEITKKICSACFTIGVTVHDHIIIAKKQFFSFKSHHLI